MNRIMVLEFESVQSWQGIHHLEKSANQELYALGISIKTKNFWQLTKEAPIDPKEAPKEIFAKKWSEN